jgi:peptidoglycan/xylan/chitin deacetylase (PgdA/CDA1 family)
MDHPHYDWCAIPTREPLRWPGGAPVALAAIVLIDHIELDPPGPVRHLAAPDGDPWARYPNMKVVGARDYGNRVGVFRVLDGLEQAGVPITVAMDVMTMERQPYLVDHCRRRGAEFLAHGISLSRPITAEMSAEEERAYIAETLERHIAMTGSTPTGWIGPEQSQSARTPQLLDAAGLDYCCDWPNDEQPYRMDTPNGLISVPTTYSVDDAYALINRNAPPETYGSLLVRTYEQLAADGVDSARSLVLVLRPWLVGLPFRIWALEDALGEITRGAVWTATTGDIAAAYRQAVGDPAASTDARS